MSVFFYGAIAKTVGSKRKLKKQLGLRKNPQRYYRKEFCVSKIFERIKGGKESASEQCLVRLRIPWGRY